MSSTVNVIATMKSLQKKNQKALTNFQISQLIACDAVMLSEMQ